MQNIEKRISTKTAVGGAVAAIFILLISQFMAQLIAVPFVLTSLPMGICNAIAGISYVCLCYFVLRLFIPKIIRLKLEDCGLPKINLKLKWIVVAVLLPAVVKGVYLIFFTGEYVSSGMNVSKIFETLCTGIFYTGIGAGFVEEMEFRGLIMTCLKERWNNKVAVLVPSVLFGFVHILGMDYSFGSCLLVILAGTMVGIMFSLIAIESGSVWNSGIVHAMWNIIIIGGGLFVGNEPDGDSVMTYVLNTKSFAVTGGDFGIESSMIALVAYLIVSVMVLVMIKKNNQLKL